MVVAVLVTLAAMNLLLARRRREEDPGHTLVRGHLLFAVLALAAAATGVVEVLLANARTPELYGTLLRAAHVPVGILVLVIPWVVWFLFRSGRPWLAVLANGVWAIALVLNAFQAHSRVYLSVTRLERLPTIGGAEFTWATGPGQPLRWVGYVGVALTLLYVCDAAIELWKRDERRRSFIVGGCLGTSLGVSLVHSAAVDVGALRSPYFISLAFLVIMAGIAYELIDEAARVPALERRVQAQEAEVAHLSRQSMLREMSVGITHELSQPISSILNNAQAALSFLDRDPPDLEEVREALVEIAGQDRHASEVLGGFARVWKAGDRQSELVDPNQVVVEVLELARAEIERRGVRISTELATPPGRLRGDRVLLSMVVLNLIRNAVDAMDGNDQADRNLVIRTIGRRRDVELIVTDSGPGVPEKDRERMFDAFFTTRPEGSGLGLAVSRTLTEMHGGSIWSSPAPGGRGTSMHVLLPTAGIPV